MMPYHVGVAFSCLGERIKWSFVGEDGISFQEVFPGNVKTTLCDVLQLVAQKVSPGAPIVLVSHNPSLLGCAKFVSEIIPRIVIMSPYDPFTKDLQMSAYDNLQEREWTAQAPARICASDASVSRDCATWAWVSKNDYQGTDFSFGVSKNKSVAITEAVAILQAVNSHRGYKDQPLIAQSDCQEAIRLVNAFFDESSRCDQVIAALPDAVLPQSTRSCAKSIHRAGLVTLQWVKGHADNELNIYADQIATYVRRRIKDAPKNFIQEGSSILKEEIRLMLQGMAK